jgi:WxL domain surface cell wall-binding
MRTLKRRIMLYVGLVIVLVLAMVSTTMTAFASLTENGPASVSATPVALNGTNQATTFSLALTVLDNGSDTANGWNLTITSTTFTAGTQKLSTTASQIKTAPQIVCSQGTCTNPTSSGITYPVGVPAAATAPTPVKFLNAAANTGTGHFTITPTITIAIPANTFAGTYTSTLTIAISSGP